MVFCNDCAYSEGISWEGITKKNVCNAFKISRFDEHDCKEFLNKVGSTRKYPYSVHTDTEFVMIYELLCELQIPFENEKTAFSPEDIEEFMKIPEFNVAYFALKYGPQE
jgi:hypothetical protein